MLIASLVLLAAMCSSLAMAARANGATAGDRGVVAPVDEQPVPTSG
jgi:hypothetical protein